ncbi:uncharacterized protein [Argopecten irradians]|uniref:uncharacterized protein n=1 Tax=Argopecten irradians TaxID=31199 RepID=UPI0037140734
MSHCVVFYTEDRSLLVERAKDLKLGDVGTGDVGIGSKIFKSFEVQDMSEEGFLIKSSREYGGFVVFIFDGKKKCDNVRKDMAKMTLEEMLVHGRLEAYAASTSRGADGRLKHALKELQKEQTSSTQCRPKHYCDDHENSEKVPTSKKSAGEKRKIASDTHKKGDCNMITKENKQTKPS